MKLGEKYDNISMVMESRIIQLVADIEIDYTRQDQITDAMFEQLLRAVVTGDLSQLKKIRIKTSFTEKTSLTFLEPELISQGDSSSINNDDDVDNDDKDDDDNNNDDDVDED